MTPRPIQRSAEGLALAAHGLVKQIADTIPGAREAYDGLGRGDGTPEGDVAISARWLAFVATSPLLTAAWQAARAANDAAWEAAR